MRIHTDYLKPSDLYSAALIARVDLTLTTHRSRSKDRAFNVTLTGESKRRPNSGSRGAGDAYAATWDQWGVFLSVLFAADPDMVTPYYESAADFAAATGDRFGAPEDTMTPEGYARRYVDYGWPEDAHGDHTFRWEGTPEEVECRKCEAVQRWGARRAQFMDHTLV